MAEGIAAAGMKVSMVNLCHTAEEYKSYKEAFPSGCRYDLYPGTKGRLYAGSHKLDKLLNNIGLAWRLFRVLKKLAGKDESVIILFRGAIETLIPAVIIKHRMKTPMIGNIMEYSPAFPSYKRNPLVRWQWRYILKESDAFMVISDLLFHKLNRLKSTLYVPALWGPKTGDQELEVRLPQAIADKILGDTPLLIYTASKEYKELLEVTLRALALVKHNFRLCITGKYSREALNGWMLLARDLDIQDRVFFCGFLNPPEFRWLEHRSTALLLPLLSTDRHRGRFPQKILHYMSLGKPIVTSHVGEIAHNFTDGINAYVDHTVTIEGFAKKISEVLSSPGKAAETGKAASLHVERSFGYIKWGKEIFRFIRSI
ncbi:MAG: glycosyltransferase family 4 protein [Deltaproteobacteria bacterium]|nr:glycosyltransferase family 4 protein [Deltaproteobacteria bacterium]